MDQNSSVALIGGIGGTGGVATEEVGDIIGSTGV